MTIRECWHACTHIPAVRTTLVILGFALMIVSPLFGVVPGPGGILVFGAGLALVLKYSDWAKRKYVAFKRTHPKKGEWTDWGLRRQSAMRRRERAKAAGGLGAIVAESSETLIVQSIVVASVTVRCVDGEGGDDRRAGGPDPEVDVSDGRHDRVRRG